MDPIVELLEGGPNGLAAPDAVEAIVGRETYRQRGPLLTKYARQCRKTRRAENKAPFAPGPSLFTRCEQQQECQRCVMNAATLPDQFHTLAKPWPIFCDFSQHFADPVEGTRRHRTNEPPVVS